MSDDQTAIRIDDVSKSFKLPHERVDSVKSLFVNPLRSKKGLQTETQHALKNISFEVKKGEFFGIVGRNGSGKSTLLKIIAGIYQPTKGKVTLKGRLVPFIELGVGFNPELTGRENVYLNGALMGFSTKEVGKKYDQIVEFAELERFMDQKLKNYSSGMQVRLAFSVATILAESDILLIDEVLAVGDADFQRKCFEYFKRVKKLKKTVVFVSHDMNAIREYCDTAVLVDESKITFSGSAETVAKEYTRLFLPAIYKAQVNDDRKRAHDVAKKSSNSKRWGSGGVRISEVEFSKGVYEEDDKTVELSYKVTAESGFSANSIPGFVIKDEEGRSICGTNTETLQIKGDELFIASGETIKLSWKMPNIFRGGKYTADVAVISGDSQETLQWCEDVAGFRVLNEKSTPYPVSPRVNLVVGR